MSDPFAHHDAILAASPGTILVTCEPDVVVSPLDYDETEMAICPHCMGLGTVECRCGGDLCVCDNYGDRDYLARLDDDGTRDQRQHRRPDDPRGVRSRSREALAVTGALPSEIW